MIHRSDGQNDNPAKDPKEPPAAAKTSLMTDDPMLAAGAAAGPAEPESAGDEAEAQAGQAPPTPEEQIEILHGQLAEVENARLRAMADIENLRKRMERDLAAARKYAISGFAADIVPLLDSFQRATAAVTPQDVEKDPALRALLDGVVMAEKQFLSVLERHGIKRVIPKGEMFNPHVHQAIAQMQNPDLPAGTIMEVAQPGFVIEDRVIRPAMVVVSQGGAKPEKAAKSVEPEQAVDPDKPLKPAKPEEAASPVEAATQPEADTPKQPETAREPDQREPNLPAEPSQQSPPAETAGPPTDAPPTEDLDAIAREVIARSRLGKGSGKRRR